MADANLPDPFPWRRFFDRAGEPVFLINRWRRLLFVNHAWEQLMRRPSSEVVGLYCKRHRRPEAGSIEALLTILAPPAEVLAGQSTRVRRLFPAKGGPHWWSITFLPLQGKKAPLGVLGTIQPDPQP